MYPYITREDYVREFLQDDVPDFLQVWNDYTEKSIALSEAAQACFNPDVPNLIDDRLETALAESQYSLSQLAAFYGLDLQLEFNRLHQQKMEGKSIE